MLPLNKPVIVSEEALVAPVLVPDVAPGLAAKAAAAGPAYVVLGGNQLLAFPQRHYAVADCFGLSDPERQLRAGLRADRHDHAGVPVYRLAAAAGGRTFHRPEGAAVFAGDRHGLYVLRTAAAERCASIRDHSVAALAGRPWIGGVSSGVGADRAACLGRALRLRAIGVSGRRQFRHVDGAAAGGADRGAVRPAQHRLVFVDRISGDRHPVADRCTGIGRRSRTEKIAAVGAASGCAEVRGVS